MDHFDKQRIADAIWTLEKYSEQLEDTGIEVLIDDAWVTVRDALRILDLVLYDIKQ